MNQHNTYMMDGAQSVPASRKSYRVSPAEPSTLKVGKSGIKIRLWRWYSGGHPSRGCIDSTSTVWHCAATTQVVGHDRPQRDKVGHCDQSAFRMGSHVYLGQTYWKLRRSRMVAKT